MRKQIRTALGVGLAMVSLWGCTGRYQEAAVVQTTQAMEESTEIAIIQQETEAETEAEQEAQLGLDI